MTQTILHCATHGDWNASSAAGCPACVAAASSGVRAPSDARALLWVGMYLLRQIDHRGHERVSEFAVNAADAAVRAFDDRYPKTKG